MKQNNRLKFSEYAQFRVERVRSIPKWDDLPSGQKPDDIAAYWRNVIAKSPEYDESQEHFAAIFLSGQGKIYGHAMIAKGVKDEVESPMDLALRAAVIAQPHAVVVAHNHPQDSPEPSEADCMIYVKMKAAAKLLGVNLLDAMVFGEKCADYPEGFAQISQRDETRKAAIQFVNDCVKAGLIKAGGQAGNMAKELANIPPDEIKMEVREIKSPEEFIKALKAFIADETSHIGLPNPEPRPVKGVPGLVGMELGEILTKAEFLVAMGFLRSDDTPGLKAYLKTLTLPAGLDPDYFAYALENMFPHGKPGGWVKKAIDERNKDKSQNAGPAPAPRRGPDLNAIMLACERDDGTGFCKACGHEQSGCEPDARHYKCEACGENQVFGAEELLIEGL